jgi:hypothetical protein
VTLDVAALRTSLDVYWTEMDRCRAAGAYFALLHLAVCVPDICSALQESPTKPEPNRDRYEAWCREYIAPGPLSPGARYDLRCGLLHEGQTGRFILAPSSDGRPGAIGGQLVVGVLEVERETREAVERWL